MQEHVYFYFLMLISDRNNVFPLSQITRIYPLAIRLTICKMFYWWQGRWEWTDIYLVTHPSFFQYSHGGIILKLQVGYFTVLHVSNFLNWRAVTPKKPLVPCVMLGKSLPFLGARAFFFNLKNEGVEAYLFLPNWKELEYTF